METETGTTTGASVAQLEEQRPCKPKVAGSIPARGSKSPKEGRPLGCLWLIVGHINPSAQDEDAHNI